MTGTATTGESAATHVDLSLAACPAAASTAGAQARRSDTAGPVAVVVTPRFTG